MAGFGGRHAGARHKRVSSDAALGDHLSTLGYKIPRRLCFRASSWDFYAIKFCDRGRRRCIAGLACPTVQCAVRDRKHIVCLIAFRGSSRSLWDYCTRSVCDPPRGPQKLFWVAGTVVGGGIVGCFGLWAISVLPPSRFPLMRALQLAIAGFNVGFRAIVRRPQALLG